MRRFLPSRPSRPRAFISTHSWFALVVSWMCSCASVAGKNLTSGDPVDAPDAPSGSSGNGGGGASDITTGFAGAASRGSSGGGGTGSSGTAGSSGGNGSAGTTGTGGSSGTSIDAGADSGGAAGIAGTGGAGGTTGSGGSSGASAAGGMAGNIATDAGLGSGGASEAGARDGAAGTSGRAGAGGAAGATGADASVPPVCTSMSSWTDDSGNGPAMRPGDSCMTCHDIAYTIMGTVYPTLHEPLNCNGKSGVQVVITPASGSAITLTTNAAGNFYSKTKVTPPFTAKVIVGGQVRSMMAAQTNGNCNACHTQDGAMQAPGRIIVP